jgi:SAM-dependent methyltransferase
MPGTLSEVVTTGTATGESGVPTSLAPVYDFVMPRRLDFAAQHRTVVEALGPDATSVLECACGTGHLLAHLDDTYEQVMGVHCDAALLEHAADRTRADLRVGDPRDLSLPRTFDGVVLLRGSLGHATTDAGLDGVFASAADHLAPGGTFVFDARDVAGLGTEATTCESYESDRYRVVRATETTVTDRDAALARTDRTYEVTDRRTGRTTSLGHAVERRCFGPEQLRSHLAEAGFRDVSIETTDGVHTVVARP